MRVWKGADTDEHWMPFICNEDGSLNKGKVLDELYDYFVLIDKASEVYCYATGGRVSNLATTVEAIEGCIDVESDKRYDEGYEIGYENGCWDGKIDGSSEGYAEGYAKGKDDGYREGVEWGKRVAEQNA